ncbi:MAG: protein translocase subunit SecDF [Bacteroidota bacterium]|nr:protein translocase subunit SecDF [Bacteroidota bacterium]
MKSQGAIKVFAIAFALVCMFQLSFTLVTKWVESDAADFANGNPILEKQYLDSVSSEKVYPILPFTYRQCKDREINLGLDLKGGMNATLEVSIPDLIRNLAKNSTNPDFNGAMDEAYKRQLTSQKGFVDLFYESFKDKSPSKSLAGIFANKDNSKYITNVSSNDEVISYIRKQATDAIDRTFKILRSRIDKFGTTQPNIQKLGTTGRILVELPGVSDPVRVKKLLQGTARLEFYRTYDLKQFAQKDGVWDRMNTAVRNKMGGIKLDTALVKDTGQQALDNKVFDSIPFAKYFQRVNSNGEENVLCYVSVKDTPKFNNLIQMADMKSLAPNVRLLYAAKQRSKSEPFYGVYIIETKNDGSPLLDGSVITDARKDVNQGGAKEISMSMNSDGAKAWKLITGQNKDKFIAIVLDSVVYSAPRVINEIPNGQSQITGNFTDEEASDMANILKAGQLPAPAHIVEEAIVGPTLGQESINAGLLSFIIALLLVLVFMVFYYSNAGWVADIALFCNVFFIMGVLASLNAVLTMPGIAGIVLTIGLSVDANILIFERIREELLSGKATSNAIRDGYKNAMSSILDSNITTLLLGIILYMFGTGPVQGFATTLIIGILTSLFSAIFITRMVFERWLSKNKEIRFSTNFSKGAFRNINIDWVKRRKSYYLFSSSIIALGVVFYFINGFNFGVGFKGGRTYTVEFNKTASNDELRAELAKTLGNPPEVKTFGESRKKITTTYKINETDNKTDSIVEGALIAGLHNWGVTKLDIKSSQKVEPTIADDIKQTAIWAILFSCVLMFIFIMIRFRKWQYGLGATVALFHDVLIILSFYTILNGVMPFTLEIDQDFIAALLTVMGYSMTDTVVVFDRIREYLNLRKKRELEGEEKITVINHALNSTLSRTLITSLTIFIVILAIFIFGGEVIRGFSFSLLIGIVIGTYSSICIATPVVVDFDKDKS